MPSRADPNLYKKVPNLTNSILIPVHTEVTTVLNGDKTM